MRSVPEVRAAVAGVRRSGGRVGFVPTMGALHTGHLSLIQRAAADSDFVVVSVFVNPTQFNDAADLAAYPRDEERDVALAAKAGAHVVFTPAVEDVYPDGFATTVRIEGTLTETFEGAARGPEHFWGVATVVSKLFAMVGPDAAYFGQKDAQQCAVVKRLVTDLNLPVEIVVCPTVREDDGLAMSSRNVHLRGSDRERAVALVEALDAAEAAVRSGMTDAGELREIVTKLMAARDLTADYVAIADADTMAPLERVDRRTVIAVAGPVGPVRLIDNIVIDPPPV
jgi:pantoate--beta-alanine ligase